MAEPPIDRFIRTQGWLDSVGEVIQKVVGTLYGALGSPGRLLKDLAHGTKPLGHPLHPALTDIPLGAWTVAVAADLIRYAVPSLPGAVGDFALGLGILGALGAAVTGYTDHHETFGHERRVATLHGLLMTLVLFAMLISLALRWKGGADAHGLAVGLAAGGLLISLFSAYLGGHLTFAIGTMVNRNAFAQGPEDYVAVGPVGDFPEGVLKLVEAGPMPVLVARVGGRIHAIANTCSHAGGPLNEGTLEGDIVICPWHASRFCLRDGRVEGGPATFPQPSFVTREQGGQVEVKLAQPMPH